MQNDLSQLRERLSRARGPEDQSTLKHTLDCGLGVLHLPRNLLAENPAEVSEDGAASIFDPEDGDSMFLRNVG